ncbi:MAG: hypothetical protein HY821_23110 [Acidobacteria bacterium]|nr:hypothetical protein [Acidobacteriota bacterium]
MVTVRLFAAAIASLGLAWAQDSVWQSRGFLENRTMFYPQEASNDKTQWVNEWLLRWETRVRLGERWRIFGGLDAQTDTHNQVERNWHLSWWDREIQRPAFNVRTLFAQYTRGPFRLELGKQVIRWGVGDVFSPTDRVSARDLLSPSGADNLGVWAVRAVADTGPHSLELLYLPRFTPSRVPLVGQRWVVLPDSLKQYRLRFRGVEYPGGPQFGVRYHGIRRGIEYSGAYFEGFQNLPSLISRVLYLQKVWEYKAAYPRIRVAGGDVSAAWRGMVWKAEGAYSWTPTQITDDFISFVVQVERVREKWQMVAGYTGLHKTVDRITPYVAIDQAFTKAFAGRFGWAPKPNNNFTAEYWLQRNCRAFIGRFLYSREIAPSLRFTGGYIWITGAKDETVGRYSINSYATLQLRYSF